MVQSEKAPKIVPVSLLFRSRQSVSRKEENGVERVNSEVESWEWLEKALWLVLSGIVWVATVLFVLECLRFPFHLHKVLIAGVLFVPLLILAGLFAVLDRLVPPR